MDFFNTARGVRLVDATLPALVDQLKQLNETLSVPKKYQYATLVSEDVAAAMQVLTNPDAYIAEDATTAALRDLLQTRFETSDSVNIAISAPTEVLPSPS